MARLKWESGMWGLLGCSFKNKNGGGKGALGSGSQRTAGWRTLLFGWCSCCRCYLHAGFCLLKRERCEYKRKEPRNGEKQKRLQGKALDWEHNEVLQGNLKHWRGGTVWDTAGSGCVPLLDWKAWGSITQKRDIRRGRIMWDSRTPSTTHGRGLWGGYASISFFWA